MADLFQKSKSIINEHIKNIRKRLSVLLRDYLDAIKQIQKDAKR